jgi:hypothetical protein
MTGRALPLKMLDMIPDVDGRLVCLPPTLYGGRAIALSAPL